jgi:hypothetical protein
MDGHYHRASFNQADVQFTLDTLMIFSAIRS